MKKILSIFVISICFILTGCGKDDETEVTLTPQELVQTTWDIVLYRYNEKGEVEHKECGIVEFLTETTGLYINGEGSGDPSTVDDLDYEIDRRKIAFKNNAIVGIWTITEKSKKRLVLQGNFPEKQEAIFIRKY